MKVYALIAIVLIAGCGGMQSTPAQPAQAKAPVIFYGDSLTALWSLPKFFPGEPYFNEGTSGLTAITLNGSFAMFVTAARPRGVVILAGTNDVWGFGTADSVFQTLTTMYAQSKDAGIPFVICTIPPMRGANSFYNPVIVDLDARLRAYAASNHIPLADYYSVLVDPATGNLRDDLALVINGALDPVHINDSGYALIAPLAEKAITELPVDAGIH